MRLRNAGSGNRAPTRSPCPAARLSSPAQRAFEDYTVTLEKRLAQQHASPDTYLAVFNLGSRRANRCGAPAEIG